MAAGVMAQERPIELGNMSVDLEGYEVRIGTQRIALTYGEFELLSLLVRQAGIVVPRRELTYSLWGEITGDRRLSVLVCRLRQKLDGSDPWRVKTVRRRGYGLLSR